MGNAENPYVVLVKAKNITISSCAINEKTQVVYGNAFEGCESLTSITIPYSVAYVGAYAFNDSKKLTIYCEAEGQISDWSDTWNPSECPVYWGDKNDN